MAATARVPMGITPPPHFVTPNGVEGVPLDMVRAACPFIGARMYTPSPASTLRDTGNLGETGYNNGIINDIAIRVPAVERVLPVSVGKDANNMVAESFMERTLISLLTQRLVAM